MSFMAISNHRPGSKVLFRLRNKSFRWNLSRSKVMKTGLGCFYCLISYLTRGKYLSTFCKVSLTPEMDRGGKPPFPNMHEVYMRSRSWSSLKSKQVLEKDQNVCKNKFHRRIRLQDTCAEVAGHSLTLHADWPLLTLLRKNSTWEWGCRRHELKRCSWCWYKDVHGDRSGIILGWSGVREEVQPPLTHCHLNKILILQRLGPSPGDLYRDHCGPVSSWDLWGRSTL